MKVLIVFLLGYLAANWIASHGGIKQAVASVQTPTSSPSIKPPPIARTDPYLGTYNPVTGRWDMNATIGIME